VGGKLSLLVGVRSFSLFKGKCKNLLLCLVIYLKTYVDFCGIVEGHVIGQNVSFAKGEHFDKGDAQLCNCFIFKKPNLLLLFSPYT